jgi:RNA polymerase-binding protein DksA
MRTTDRKANHIEDYRSLLLVKRSELLPKHPGKFDLLAETGHLPDEDKVMLLHDEFVSMRLTTLQRETLKHIDAALERLTSGEYGICIECGDPISARRLRAIPWASRCIRCEENTSAGPDPTELSGKAA